MKKNPFICKSSNLKYNKVKEILTSEEDIADIIAGKVGFTLEPYTDKNFGRECVGVRWVDLEA